MPYGHFRLSASIPTRGESLQVGLRTQCNSSRAVALALEVPALWAAREPRTDFAQ